MMINQTDRSRTLWRAELVTGPEAPDLMKCYFLEEKKHWRPVCSVESALSASRNQQA